MNNSGSVSVLIRHSHSISAFRIYLNYHNTLLTGLAASSLALMELISPCTARVLKCKSDYALPLLKNLYWHSIICPLGSGQAPMSGRADSALAFQLHFLSLRNSPNICTPSLFSLLFLWAWSAISHPHLVSSYSYFTRSFNRDLCTASPYAKYKMPFPR